MLEGTPTSSCINGSHLSSESFNPAFLFVSEGRPSTPAEWGLLDAGQGQAPWPLPALSRDSHPAVTCSWWLPLGQPGHGQHEQFLGKGIEILAHLPIMPRQQLVPSLTGPSTPSPYQGSRKDKKLPCLRSKADRDQPTERRAAAPLGWGDCVLKAVHSKPRLPATLHT